MLLAGTQISIASLYCSNAMFDFNGCDAQIHNVTRNFTPHIRKRYPHEPQYWKRFSEPAFRDHTSEWLILDRFDRRQ